MKLKNSLLPVCHGNEADVVAMDGGGGGGADSRDGGGTPVRREEMTIICQYALTNNKALTRYSNICLPILGRHRNTSESMT